MEGPKQPCEMVSLRVLSLTDTVIQVYCPPAWLVISRGIFVGKEEVSIMSLLTWRRNISYTDSYRPCFVLRYPGKMQAVIERLQAPACP